MVVQEAQEREANSNLAKGLRWQDNLKSHQIWKISILSLSECESIPGEGRWMIKWSASISKNAKEAEENKQMYISGSAEPILEPWIYTRPM